jgi:polyphosphate kinase 2
MSKNGKGKNKDKRAKDRGAAREKLENATSGELKGSAAAADYGKELRRLQMEIAHLQAWVKKSKARVVIIFEGRDAAGKGGVIKRITERVSPRVFRVVALPAPTDREKSQIYMQRYIPHLPAAGEVVIFDRSWYNRPGVERVMGFCSEEVARRFLELAPRFEAAIVESGIILLKYFLDVSEDEQERRFRQRIGDPLRQWKLSPMDVESYQRWWDYSIAYDEMIRMTDTEYAPWWIVRSDDKKRARINCISHILSIIPYDKVKFVEPELGKRQKRPDDYVESPHVRRYVPNVIN